MDLVYTLSSDAHSSPTWTDEPAEPPILQVCAVAGWPSGWRHSPPPLALTPSPSSSPSPGSAAPANAKALSIRNTGTYSVILRDRYQYARKGKIPTFLNEGKVTQHENPKTDFRGFL
jgi:hypothetical protein